MSSLVDLADPVSYKEQTGQPEAEPPPLQLPPLLDVISKLAEHDRHAAHRPMLLLIAKKLGRYEYSMAECSVLLHLHVPRSTLHYVMCHATAHVHVHAHGHAYGRSSLGQKRALWGQGRPLLGQAGSSWGQGPFWAKEVPFYAMAMAVAPKHG